MTLNAVHGSPLLPLPEMSPCLFPGPFTSLSPILLPNHPHPGSFPGSINSFQLDNLVKRMGRSMRLSQTNGLCWASSCLSEGGAVAVPGLVKRKVVTFPCRLSSALDSAPESSHFTHLHLDFLTADLHFTPFPSSQIFHYDTPTTCLPPFSPGQIS